MSQLNEARKQYINRKLAEKSLYDYILQSWSYVDPATFIDNWHIKFIADHLQAFFLNQIPQDLIVINIPPGMLKSLITSVFLPTWMWIDKPETRWLTGSKTEELAIRDSRRARDLLSTEWYQRQWAVNPTRNKDKIWTFKDDENRKRGYENDKQGYRNIFSVLSNVTGKRGYRIIYDPNDAGESYNPKRLQETNDWYGNTFSTRVNILERTKTAIIQQRISENDLSGYLLNTFDKQHLLHICLPMEFEPEMRCITSLGQDPRTKQGELLMKSIFPEEIAKQKMLLGNLYSAQYQQRPSPIEGAIFKLTDFHDYKQSELPSHFDMIIDSIDIAEKTGKSNDYTCLTVWGILGNKKYLLDLWRGKLEYPDLKIKYEEMGDAWKPHQRLIEDKSSGTPLLQEIKSTSRYPILAIKPKGSKEARADAVRPEFQACNVLFPEQASWRNSYVEELLLFPNGAHDDQVDSTTQFLNHIRGGAREPRMTIISC